MMMMMNRKANSSSSNCAFCESSNHPSICSVCVNYRLNEYYYTNLRALKSKRDAFYTKLTDVLMAKGKADDQKRWIMLQNEKVARSREKLLLRKEQLLQGKAKIGEMSRDLKEKYELLESSMKRLESIRLEQLEKFFPNLICTQSLGHMSITSERLHRQSVIIKQICKLFPQRRLNIEGENKEGNGPYDAICNARLPRGLDPHSVPSEELAASLGCMVQLLNLVIHNVCAPALHNSGFAGSCSRIWQRDSYWDARPSSRSSEYPLFIPRQTFCSTGGENSWTERSSSNFGVTSMESVKKLNSDSRSSSFNYSSASPHSREIHKDLQKGISLLKKSVACVTAYCYNSLGVEVPSEVSTFEAFSRLLATLSSSKEIRSVLSFKMASSRSPKQVHYLNKSVWNVDSAISSSTLMESAHVHMRNTVYNNLPNSTTSFLFAPDFSDTGKTENFIEGWDIVEHPTFPPPPSQTEDIEHWTRAMFIDATKK
ncbi:hypothetical protein Leryth_024438 [Lithospermum erythrorhizon]|nr:hypothetical protein Leryth_024438 [Lithospermum erythrorhizon]